MSAKKEDKRTWRRQTRCARGHPLEGKNVAWSKNYKGIKNIRCCRECKNRRSRERYATSEEHRLKKIQESAERRQRLRETGTCEGIGRSAAEIQPSFGPGGSHSAAAC